MPSYTIPPEEEKYVRLARKIHPDWFSEEASPRLGYRMNGITSVRVIHVNPPQRFSAAHYRIRISYAQMFRHVKRPSPTWELMTGQNPVIETPDIIVVQRENIKVDHFELLKGMKTVFKANVLVLKRYTGEQTTRKGLKNVLRNEGIWLVFADELL